MWGAEGTISYSDQGLVSANGSATTNEEEAFRSRFAMKARFVDFIRNFRQDNCYIYRDQLHRHVNLGYNYLEIDLQHLLSFDELLSNQLTNRPLDILPLFEAAAKEAVQIMQLRHGQHQQTPASQNLDGSSVGATGGSAGPDIQIILQGASKPLQLRALHADTVSKIVVVPGMVIAASKPQAKVTAVTAICRACHAVKHIPCAPGMSGVSLPRRCDRGGAGATDPSGVGASCPPEPYVVVAERSHFVDHQILKLQEHPQSVPTGEMPRNIVLSCDRALVSRVVPGARVLVTGIFSIPGGGGRKANQGGANSVRNPYLMVLGMAPDNGTAHSSSSFYRDPSNVGSHERSGRSEGTDSGRGGGSQRSIAALAESCRRAVFLPEEEQEFQRLSREPNLYSMIAASIAPAICGHADIKRALACQLFGGSRKQLPDGVRLRGDVNVLLLGDPGTAKSQFLKFQEKLAPGAGVYTSGKGSSAAGLTASVRRDPHTREFFLEGGALVLADGGIVCIDEFDKMHLRDRVAIHEAMEQQTISIAKAGITTVLNARAAVLAAANPVFGRYDDVRSPLENIEFQATILSRFDLIFLVRDRQDESRDRAIADHVMELHIRNRPSNFNTTPSGRRGGRNNSANSSNNTASSSSSTPSLANIAGNDAFTHGTIELSLLKQYITYARARCSPRLSQDAANALRDQYVNFRTASRRQSGDAPAVPITVRQLEAIIRLAESLAKMTLSPVATRAHVEEAVRLFRCATMEAAACGALGAAEATLTPEQLSELGQVEQLIRRRVAIGASVSEKRLVEHFGRTAHLPENLVRRALLAMVQRDEMEFRSQRKVVYRKR